MKKHHSKHSAYEIAFPQPRLALLSHFLSPLLPFLLLSFFFFFSLSACSHYLKYALSFLSHRESFQVAVEDKLPHAVWAQGGKMGVERPSSSWWVFDRKPYILLCTSAENIWRYVLEVFSHDSIIREYRQNIQITLILNRLPMWHTFFFFLLIVTPACV